RAPPPATRTPRWNCQTTTTPSAAPSSSAARRSQPDNVASASSRTARSQVPLEVWKFGGASRASGDQHQKAAALVAKQQGPLVVVPSALSGITDLLLEGAAHALAGRRTAVSKAAATFLRRQREVVPALLA